MYLFIFVVIKIYPQLKKGSMQNNCHTKYNVTSSLGMFTRLHNICSDFKVYK